MTTQSTRQALLQLEAKLREEIAALPFPDIQKAASGQSLGELIDTLTALHLADEPIYERLTRLDAAQCQLDLGLYGLCADCESEIESERLIADPTEQRCLACDDHFRHEHRLELRLNH
ncbi:TraR/DksA C4-type zinc finger protein [Shewanella khirikhana]|uniref:RNA polymerase-binding transcription factor DksA n=1 Tax=Shewanella khirikhana TaxID=1965282 RepID=A0ABN5TR86_9GAMM|nr:TraR/DksA C4-type zinc finger protein [Shewanella khirikhana]AZQ10009.1 RNA polymerase-binding transcription factor DksA [Shewanella khirikhana]